MRFIDKSKISRLSFSGVRGESTLTVQVNRTGEKPVVTLLLDKNEYGDEVNGEIEIDPIDVDSLVSLLDKACARTYRDVVSGRIHQKDGRHVFTVHADTMGEPFRYGVSFEYGYESGKCDRYAHVFVEDEDGRKIANLLRTALPEAAAA